MTVVTRMAPSPTGFAHVGTMRTALFNWLYARHHGGQFLLRIEDTDKSRNVDEAIQPIIDGLAWLGIVPDGDIVYQSQRAARHVAVANELIARGEAFRCYMSDEEVAEQKAANRPLGKPFRSRYRDNIPQNAISNEAFDKPSVVRLRAPRAGTITISDAVQGDVSVEADTIDDLVLLRSDGTPTYMLAVVVDDHDMGVNTIIRGDDHLSNAFRQLTIIRGMDWPEPRYAHIPLIHDEAGKKLSKRTGAAGVEFYRDSGIVPEAMLNYLLRLGWGHGDHELFTIEDAVRLFDLDGVGKAPSRLDYRRLEFLNGNFIRDMDAVDFVRRLVAFAPDFDPALIGQMAGLVQPRSKTLVEAVDYVRMVAGRHAPHDMPWFMVDVREVIAAADFTADGLKHAITAYGEANNLKLKHVMAPLRLALMGSKVSPPLFEVMVILGLDETLVRIQSSIYFTNNIS